ncbi:type IV secretion system DNA-binding domain-containing protein, partial [Vibrio anguillarum]|uniref:type IV secretion system DNA-binding domain-containing protein n=1 Tax=Vibrio anguillarum TaxID=55601 RepID=UPI00188ABF33
MESPFDADWISETLLPSSNSNSGSEKFFTSAARAVVSAALQNLYLDGPKSLLSLLRATARNDLELLKELVAGTPAETYFNEDNERTLESIRSTIVDGVRPLRLLKEENKKGFFSIRDWIAEGDEPNADDSWLFLPVRESEIEIQKPLISTWIQAAAKGLMARGVNNERTLWIVVDELPSLKKIPALSMLMAEGRGFGAAVVLGIQEINQLEEEFGKNTSKTILGLCSTQFHFRLNNADTAEWVSKVLGEAEREEVDEDLNYSADDIRDGVRVSSKRQNRKIVLPSEIMDLPDLSCFAKIWGVESKARID